MRDIECQEFLEYAGPWTEGERPAEAEAHLGTCARCRSLLADLEAIRSAARRLAEHEPEPPAHIWTTLRVQLQEEGIVREEPRRSWVATWLPAIPRPVLAGAYLTLLLAGGIFLGTQQWEYWHARSLRKTWLNGMQATMTPVGSQLHTAAEKTIQEVQDPNPAITEELHENLAIVDKYIVLCEKSVREEPENQMARDYLYNAYEQKADLVAELADRGGNAR